MQKHLAIFKKGEDEEIFSGKKTIESRFSIKKIAPYGVVSSGDIIYIKPAGKDIKGQFRVQKVIFIDGVAAEDIQALASTFGCTIASPNVLRDTVKEAKYGTLIFITQVERFLTPPVKISKKDSRTWVVLG